MTDANSKLTTEYLCFSPNVMFDSKKPPKKTISREKDRTEKKTEMMDGNKIEKKNTH